MDCRVLKNKKCKITQNYSDNHKAIDIVGENNTLDYIVAHSDGIIIFLQDGLGNMKGSLGQMAYGNCVKIDHQNGYYTLYAHMNNDLPVKNKQYVKKGQTIGYMSDSGNAYNQHLHFEVWQENTKINPIEYLNRDLPSNQNNKNTGTTYKIGDIVEINGVYISSTSQEKLRPLITQGKITKIIQNANNPYLLENGNIGWVNDRTIISRVNTRYLFNKTYKGSSIVDALKEINIASSYNNRSKLATINGIKNYQGTANQNTEMLNLLKQGLLKY